MSRDFKLLRVESQTKLLTLEADYACAFKIWIDLNNLERELLQMDNPDEPISEIRRKEGLMERIQKNKKEVESLLNELQSEIKEVTN
jgi:hypothetical protein